MKIALQLSGQLRTVLYCFPSIFEKIVKPYNCDIFAYVPKEDELEFKIKVLKEHNAIIKIFEEKDLSEKEYYKKAQYKYSKFGNQGILKQLLYLKEVNKLRTDYELKNNFKYDWVIRCRYDIKIKESIENLFILDSSKLYVSDHDHYDGINDRLWFSSSDIITKICDNLIIDIDEFIKNGGLFHAESYFYSFCLKNEIVAKPSKGRVVITRDNNVEIPIRQENTFPKFWPCDKNKWQFSKKLINGKVKHLGHIK